MASQSSLSGSSASSPIDKLQAGPDALRKEAESSAEFEKLQEEAKIRRLQALLAEQNSQPMTINRLQVHGATNTRRGFLDPIFQPLLAEDVNSNSTLGEVAARLGDARGKLERLGIFHPDPKVHLNSSNQTDPSTTPTDVDVDVVVKELSRYKFNAGTDVGNSEGSAYTSLLWRNIFGGAEQLTVNASAGTRTRSAYSATLSAPVQSNPDTRIALEGLASATDKSWAAHEEVLKGGNLRFSWLSGPKDMHSLEYSGIWRQVTGLRDNASPTVRADAGDSVKSSVKHTYQRDQRDNPQLPQSGYVLKSVFELAGVGPLGGDVAFSKNELEVGGAVPVPVPGVKGPSGVSIGGGFRFGMLYPLPLGFSSGGKAQPSRINDRFQLGGPTDVRGFHYGGLGPHDGQDSVGGDVFAAGSVNMLFPLPYKGPESSLRFQVFANGGRLVAMQNKTKGGDSPSSLDAGSVASSAWRAVSDLATGLPSTAAGVGLVYAHPVARFELNFSLPLVLRRGEQGTKGLQVGVGINFL
ncbi:Putative bacterial surface antigen (D15), surface antigen D15 [Colletotrichum destructivum]|uniref:Bacterial surface antigen (D15), surface antigen D15 n=1 Tax=Colletotrichum destructivum TaxID=34406 RepID=A0AAX4IU62_9PEZI|nr:Putative bacterial surface antigen (D15), surface antigen D15 [Colletotrichum destructivum]